MPAKVFHFSIMSNRNYVERSVSRDLGKGLGGSCRSTYAYGVQRVLEVNKVT